MATVSQHDDGLPHLTEGTLAQEFLDLVAEEQVVVLLADVEAILVVKPFVLRPVLGRRLLGRQLAQVVHRPEHSQ